MQPDGKEVSETRTVSCPSPSESPPPERWWTRWRLALGVVLVASAGA